MEKGIFTKNAHFIFHLKTCNKPKEHFLARWRPLSSGCSLLEVSKLLRTCSPKSVRLQKNKFETSFHTPLLTLLLSVSKGVVTSNISRFLPKILFIILSKSNWAVVSIGFAIIQPQNELRQYYFNQMLANTSHLSPCQTSCLPCYSTARCSSSSAGWTQPPGTSPWSPGPRFQFRFHRSGHLVRYLYLFPDWRTLLDLDRNFAILHFYLG